MLPHNKHSPGPYSFFFFFTSLGDFFLLNVKNILIFLYIVMYGDTIFIYYMKAYVETFGGFPIFLKLQRMPCTHNSSHILK